MQYDTFSHYPSILLSKNAKLPDARRIYVSLSMYSTHSASCMCTRKIGHLGDVYLIYWKQYILLYQICLTNAGRSSTLRDPVPASHLIAKHSWLLEASCCVLGDFSDRLLLLCVSTWAEKTSRTRTKSLMASFFFFTVPTTAGVNQPLVWLTSSLQMPGLHYPVANDAIVNKRLVLYCN